jgi:mannose/fructose/N-acetylgalactosamine-specific phosphotransferase system component IIC
MKYRMTEIIVMTSRISRIFLQFCQHICLRAAFAVLWKVLARLFNVSALSSNCSSFSPLAIVLLILSFITPLVRSISSWILDNLSSSGDLAAPGLLIALICEIYKGTNNAKLENSIIGNKNIWEIYKQNVS